MKNYVLLLERRALLRPALYNLVDTLHTSYYFPPDFTLKIYCELKLRFLKIGKQQALFWISDAFGVQLMSYDVIQNFKNAGDNKSLRKKDKNCPLSKSYAINK